ncbi:MAG: hypothetical protein HYZ75_13930 [Elusimicrobia bacterium]|nr:hypothetical protein [Elusimicrobiota bacterium]
MSAAAPSPARSAPQPRIARRGGREAWTQLPASAATAARTTRAARAETLEAGGLGSSPRPASRISAKAETESGVEAYRLVIGT